MGITNMVGDDPFYNPDHELVRIFCQIRKNAIAKFLGINCTPTISRKPWIKLNPCFINIGRLNSADVPISTYIYILYIYIIRVKLNEYVGKIGNYYDVINCIT